MKSNGRIHAPGHLIALFGILETKNRSGNVADATPVIILDVKLRHFIKRHITHAPA